MGFEEHPLAEVVQAGVRFVENHEMRIAKNARARRGAGETHAKDLDRSANDDGIVRLRSRMNHVVKAGQLCCVNDLLQIGTVPAAQ